MIRIGKLTDYAMLITGEIAKMPVSSILSAAALADTLHLPLPTVSKVLKMLSEAALVSAVRGAEGGYFLARPADQISVADIILAMEGEIALTECCERQGRCTIDALCTMRENWIEINRMIHSWLAALTIVDMNTPLSQAGFLQRLAHVK